MDARSNNHLRSCDVFARLLPEDKFPLVHGLQQAGRTVGMTGVFVTTPKLILLLLFTNDFITMSIATDRVAFAR